ncbi:TPA: bifunctional adenosylcobinamide kinase/adenosylcobinamide-phosphate guanylyltransferase [Candidatus Poribacteria bacterium]|nr:bifunctional adenosylcobinamide kinase/adenosylcobinamide-phosphate guanylyltransferase [Candidatus Poribacteria bacterium]
MSVIFITGGARSGKSSFALQLAKKLGGKVAFIATAQAGDEEMQNRIQIHKQDRPNEWTTIEEPFDVESAIESAKGHNVVIVDCITLLLSNLICSSENFNDTSWIFTKIENLIESAKKFVGTVIIISNEVGMGIVPENRLAREFRDLAGKANQMIANSADQVYVCFSGIPILIKSSGEIDGQNYFNA